LLETNERWKRNVALKGQRRSVFEERKMKDDRNKEVEDKEKIRKLEKTNSLLIPEEKEDYAA